MTGISFTGNLKIDQKTLHGMIIGGTAVAITVTIGLLWYFPGILPWS